MITKFFMHERNVNNSTYYFIFFINNHGKQHKMLKKRPIATGLLQTVIRFFICKRKVSKFILYYFFFH